MNQTLRQCDDDIGLLLDMIDKDEYLKKNLNVIITSDHGMHSIEKAHKITLENYIDKSLFTVYGARSFANIFVKNSLLIFLKSFLTCDCFLFQKTILTVSIESSQLFPTTKSTRSPTFPRNIIIKRMYALVVSDRCKNRMNDEFEFLLKIY